MRALFALLALLGACVLSGCVDAAVAGSVAADGRAFPLSPKYLGQLPGNAVSIAAEPQLSIASKNEHHTVTLRPFYRLDPIDVKRTHADLRRADYRLSLEHFQLGLGVGQVGWGVLESFKPTDVFNQTDFVERIDGTAKLGQPYAEAAWVGETAALRFYYLPYFRDRTFPGLRGRLRFPVVVDTKSAIFGPHLGRLQPSFAVRFTKSIGGLDLGLGVLSGLGREPRYVAEISTGEVVPRYDAMHQVFGDAQWAIGAVTLKGEAFLRAWSTDARVVSRDLHLFAGGGVGADYTFFKVVKEADVSLAAEFLFDTRPITAAPIFFDHDAFGGVRLALNDTASTEFLGGAIVDVLTGYTFGRAKLSRRFFEHWNAALEAMIFAVGPGRLESSFRRDSNGQARLAYFF